jgi:hypothetical protein
MRLKFLIDYERESFCLPQLFASQSILRLLRQG